MATQPADKQTRASIRTGVAFWLATDRRSITEGPPWLWRGEFVAPLRACDLPDVTSTKISHRRHTLPAAHVDDPTVTPRALRAPWVTGPAMTGWAAAAAVATVVAILSATMSGDRVGLATIATWAAVAAAAIALLLGAVRAWMRADPARLDRTDMAAIAEATRRLRWNPLAGAGKISLGGAYVMEGIEAVSAVDDHPAWALPATAVLHSRFDSAEEIFQIARAAHRLDEIGEPAAREHHLLESALLQRLVALRTLQQRLDGLGRHAEVVLAAPAAAAAMAAPDGYVAVVENELAAETLAGLSAEVTALRAGYAELQPHPPTSPDQL